MSADLIHSLWVAAALMLVIEGIVPFLSPSMLRQTLFKLISMSDNQIRTMGLISMLLGILFLYWID